MARPTPPNAVGRRMAVAIRNSSLWLALLGISLLSFGCATAPMLTPPAVIVPTPALKGVRIALVEFVPLPTTYPVGAKPVFPTLTGELYEEEKVFKRPALGTTSTDVMTSFVDEEKAFVRSFVPRDHLTILTETMLVAMKEKGIAVQLSPSLSSAQRSGANLIVMGILREFNVGNVADYDGRRRQQTPSRFNAQANIRVSWTIFSGQTGARLWEGELQQTVDHSRISTNAFIAQWIQVLAIGESSLHPLRTLLAVASYNLAAQLVERLDEAAALTEGVTR